MLKVDCEEGPFYLHGINNCWPVANEVEVTEKETTITTLIPAKCILIIIEFVNVVFNCTLHQGLHAAPRCIVKAANKNIVFVMKTRILKFNWHVFF